MKPIGFLAYEGVEELDLVGPWEMATMWRDYADGPDCVIVAKTPGMLTCAKGMPMGVHHGFADAPELSALLVPGGFAAFDVMKDDETLDYVRHVGQMAEHMLSVCSGSFILLAVGLLEKRRATTHWKAIDALRDAGVDVSEDRFTRDGPIWTSAGVSAGIDLMLHFIAETQGREVADIVQHNAEYYPDASPYGDLHKGANNPAYMKRLS